MNIDIIEPAHGVRLPASSKVSAVHHDKSRLYVGLNSGDLLVYSTKIKASPKVTKALDTQLTQNNDFEGPSKDQSKESVKDGSEKSTLEVRFPNITKTNLSILRISTLDILNESNKIILAITCVDSIRIYEIVGKHLNLIQELSDIKSSDSSLYIQVNPTTRLFIAGTKKKLCIYEVVNKTRNIIQLQKGVEIALKDKVKSINPYPSNSSAAPQVLVGLVNSFIVVDLTNNFSVHDLSVDESSQSSLHSFNNSTSFGYFGLSSSGPTAIQVAHNKMILIKDTSVVLLDTDQPKFVVSPIKLSVRPIFIAAIAPLYLLMVYSKKIEILDWEQGDLIQVHNHSFSSSQIVACLDEDHVFVGSGSDILSFKVLGYQRQIDQFLSISGKGSSSGSVKDPNNDLKIIGLAKSISLVTKIDSDNVLFQNESESSEKKKQLVLRQLYKKKAIILFQSYSKYHESLVEICSDWLVFYRDVLGLFPDFLNPELLMIENGDFPKLNDDSDSVRSFSRSVIKRISINDIQNFNRSNSTGDSATDNEGGHIKSSRDHFNQNNVLHHKSSEGFSKSQNIRKFVKAVNNLIIYLTDQRRVHFNFMDMQKEGTLEWKGTTITPFDIYPFVTRENLRSQLDHIASVIDTALFLCYFHTKPMLLGPLLRLPNNHCNAKIVNKSLLSNIQGSHRSDQPNFVKELLDFYYGRELHLDALEMLYKLSHGEDDSPVDQNSGSNDVDGEFDRFIKGPELTIQYLQKLKNDNLDLIFQFSYWEIIEQKSLELQIQNAKLIFMNDTYECESYDNFKVLNFFTDVLKIDALAIYYLEWLLLESDLVEKLTKSNSLGKLHTKLCLLYLKKLKQSSNLTFDEFAKSEYYGKLYSFLETHNDLYEPWTVLKNIPNSDDKFSRLKIFIYKRLGEHEKAIDVLFNQLEDLDSAILYCSDIYNQVQSQKKGEDLLQKLLEDLVNDENIESVEKLLISQGSKMSIFKVLTSLPNQFPLARLSKYLTKNLRDSQEILQDGRLAAQLYKVGSVKLQDSIWDIQRQGYTIESGKQTCSICERKLGYSVFSVDKNGQIVHYGCANKGSQP